MLIYCAHKYGGNEDNKTLVEDKIRRLQIKDPLNTYISPIHTFGYMYDDMSYDVGMDLCLSLLERCDALLVLSGDSEGVKREKRFAILNNIPIYTEQTFKFRNVR
jgi:hypothetical protein